MNSTPVEFLVARHRALVESLRSASVDALIVAHRPNVAYLSDFFGSAGVVVAAADGLTLVSDARYGSAVTALAELVPGLTAEIVPPGGGSIDERLTAVLASRAPARVGFEAAHVSVAQHTGLLRRLDASGCQAEWVGLEEVVELLRQVKDAWEIGVLREAGRRLSDVSKCIISKALAGVSERQVAAALEWELRQKGFDKPAFDTIVASGPNGAMPHHRAGDRVLEAGDLVVVDFGGMFNGYAVDMTRTVSVGPPTSRQQACWTTVATAQRAAFRAARVGVTGDDVDAAARGVIDAAGMAAAFAHGLGHGLGLEVHERPRLARRRPGVSGEPLAAGMVFTLEPGVYFPGWGGVRIEDDAVATVEGPQWLTEPAEDLWTT